MRRAARIAVLFVFVTHTAATTAAARPAPSTHWRQVGVRTFYGADAEIRSQGIATDGHDLFFSSQLTLMRTAANPSSLLAINPYAIPLDMVLQGSNHIGDIDVYGGKVYAPIEDGTRYLRPYIAIYDAKTLLYTGVRYGLPQKLLVEGVPWVAVDAARKRVYTAEWNNTRVLNIHSMTDMHIIKTLRLSAELGRIQGAKMLDGLLYAAEDNGNRKSIVAIDPHNGVVSPVFDRNLPAGTEAEGLTFTRSGNDTFMRTLEVAPDGLSVLMRTFVRVQPR